MKFVIIATIILSLISLIASSILFFSNIKLLKKIKTIKEERDRYKQIIKDDMRL